MKLNRFFSTKGFSLSGNLQFVRSLRFLFGIALFIVISIPLHGQKKLFKAISKGKVDAVSSYISKGGDLNRSYENFFYDYYYGEESRCFFTPLEYAALHDQIEVLRLLMQNKEKINEYQLCLNKAFGVSISSGNMEMIRLLMDAGVDINTKCESCYGQSAIQIAMEYYNFELAEELMEQGANLQVSNKMGRTLLHTVAHSDNILLAGKLINSGLDVNAKDEDGASAICFAASNGNFEMLKLFEENSADLLLVENDGRDIMMSAAIGGNVEIINFLIDKGIDVNTTNDEGWSPLLFACSEDHQEEVEALIEASAELDVMNDEGETPLLWALWNSNARMARTLIEAGASLDNMYDYRKYAKSNIKDKAFLSYLENKYIEL